MILLAVFLGGISLFSQLQNQHSTVGTTELGAPTLPVMCIDRDGNKINSMPGYRTEMKASTMRDSIIPITTNREFSVSYKAYDQKVISVSYEIIAPDTGKVVENAKIGGFQEDGDYMTARVSLTEPILMNREYPVKFTIETSEGDVYYYSRLLQRSELPVNLYVQFVYNFYETCMNKDGAGDLNTYLETDSSISNRSFTNVNINSTLDQVTWGDLSPQIYQKAVPNITEINSETCSITNDYLIRAVNESGQTEIYHVTEFYRLRYYNGSMSLLDFYRTALQVFDENLSVVTTEGVNLGIAERSVQYLGNTSSDIVAFVQDGALWEYSESAEKLSLVYSLKYAEEGTDERYQNNDYDIQILSVSEGGDIDFIVYGYMNRGPHEGENGISVCHFENERTVVNEQLFIPSERSYDYLKQDLDILSYVSSGGVYYAYLNENLCKFDPVSGTSEILQSGIRRDCITASSEYGYAAWMNEMDPDAGTDITLMYLDEESTRTITAESGTYIRALGFLNDDFLYGIADRDDLVTGAAGDVTFAMNRILIEDFGGNVIKEYDPGENRITSVDVSGGLVTLTRSSRDGDVYTEESTDNIMNNRIRTESQITTNADYNSRQGITITLAFPTTNTNLKPLIKHFTMMGTAEAIEYEAEDAEPLVPQYYAYGEGRLQGIFTHAGKALIVADAHYGTLLDGDGAFLYERGNLEKSMDLNDDDIPEGFFSRTINAAAVQEEIGEEAQVINLTGATMDEVEYELSRGRAVKALKSDGTVCLIVGYDGYNTLQYDFETGEHFYVASDDSREDFEGGGNVFVSYVLPQRTIKNS